MPPLPETDAVWSVRVLRHETNKARVVARRFSFDVGSQAGLSAEDGSPSAIEFALGGLGGDLLCGFQREAAGRQLVVHDIELTLSGRLDNVLVHLGVIGEQGHAGFASISGVMHIAAEADESIVRAAWQATLDRSPLFNTLTRCTEVDISLRLVT